MNDWGDRPVDRAQLKIDVKKLWDFGAIDLPEFSSAYVDASNKVFDAATLSTFSYNRGGPGTTPPAFETLIESLEFFQSDILATTSKNLLNIGKVFERVSLEIAGVDDNTEKSLNKHAKEQLDEVYGDDAPSPGEHAKDDPDEDPRDIKDHDSDSGDYGGKPDDHGDKTG